MRLKIVTKARKLCEYIPDLILNYAEFSVTSNKNHVAIGIILLARAKC
jgi:hypothetical protein